MIRPTPRRRKTVPSILEPTPRLIAAPPDALEPRSTVSALETLTNPLHFGSLHEAAYDETQSAGEGGGRGKRGQKHGQLTDHVWLPFKVRSV
jgi:hypothetical protein